MPTENDLARKYNASRQTVRKALNLLDNEGYLKKKQGVGTFLKESPKRDTKNVGFISISLHDYIFSDILRGADSVLHEQGYQILLGNSRDSQEREREILNEFMEKEIDGLIIEPAKSAYQYNNLDLLEKFDFRGIPVIVLDSKFEKSDLNYITINDEKGGYLAGKHFIENGHTKIAMIYKGLHKPSLARCEGFQKALNDSGITVRDEYLKEYFNSEFEKKKKFKEEVKKFTRDLMNLDEKPTGIFCFNDQVAILAKEILNEMGFLVPEDISLIGFDNSNLVKLNNIDITSIDHPKTEAGRKAANIFLENLSRVENKFYENIVFEPQLVKRNSVKKLN